MGATAVLYAVRVTLAAAMRGTGRSVSGDSVGNRANDQGPLPAPDLVARYSWLKLGPLLAFLGLLTIALGVFGIAEGEIVALVVVPIIGASVAFFARHLVRRTPMIVVAADRLEYRGMPLYWSSIKSITPRTRYIRGWPQRSLRVDLDDITPVIQHAPTRVIRRLAEASRQRGDHTLEIPLNLLTVSPKRIVAAVSARHAERPGSSQ
jgi:hypothetical protein